MPDSQLTCWTVIEAAAAGQPAQRQEFALRYEPVIRAYLAARWRGSPWLQELDEAAQEVFVEFFRDGGPLERADRERGGGFRPFFYGVARNVARRFEQRPHSKSAAEAPAASLADMPADDPTLSYVFDRAWAQTILRDAAERQAALAAANGEDARRRVSLLKMRFQDGLPIRDIAIRWNVTTEHVHHEYAKARREFQAALHEVVAFHRPGATHREIEDECLGLLDFFTPRRPA